MIKKILIFLFFTLLVTQPALAQRNGGRILRQLRKWFAAEQSVTQLPAATEGLSHLSAAVNNQVAAMQQLTHTQASLSGRGFVPVHPDLWSPLPPEMADYTQSVFRARSLGEQSEVTFSGVAFKTTYLGQEEMFGVVAAHALSPEPGQELLGSEFTAEVFSEGGFTTVRAKLVQVSATSTLDLALIKFRPEDEELFTPLTLAKQEVSADEGIVGLGFGQGKWVLSKRRFLAKTPFSIRTSFTVPWVDRGGLCGSAVLNAKHELLGIHTGSTRDVEYRDIGYATPAEFLNTLVEAYHNNGNATFPLYLNGEKIASLRLDEFISYVRLKNDKGLIIWRREVRDKFPYQDIMERLPRARYIELSVNKAVWTGNYLQQDHLLTRSVEYDFKTKREVR